jgi:hypothetical protein
VTAAEPLVDVTVRLALLVIDQQVRNLVGTLPFGVDREPRAAGADDTRRLKRPNKCVLPGELLLPARSPSPARSLISDQRLRGLCRRRR